LKHTFLFVFFVNLNLNHAYFLWISQAEKIHSPSSQQISRRETSVSFLGRGLAAIPATQTSVGRVFGAADFFVHMRP